MRQTARFVTVNGRLWIDYDGTTLDKEEALYIARVMIEDGAIKTAKAYEVISRWYNIGEGDIMRIGVDEHYTDIELTELCMCDGGFDDSGLIAKCNSDGLMCEFVGSNIYNFASDTVKEEIL